jgi:hypothetical protein
MKKLIVLLWVVLLGCKAWAQEPQTSPACPDVFQCLTAHHEGSGSLKVIQDDKLKRQVIAHVEWHHAKKTIKGYRIRIFSDSGQPARQSAMNERARFSKLYPGYESYLNYDSPNYKVYVGDFTTRSEAYAFLMKIKGDFPKAFPVEQKINFK